MGKNDISFGPPRRQLTSYRPCVGIMLFNSAGHVFVGQRQDRMVEAWQMPQGGIDDGEEPTQAAFREMLEEIGTDKADIVTETADWLTYDLPDDLKGTVWKGRYRGQIQKWYLMRFTGSDKDVNIKTKHPEFRSWRWAPYSELTDLAVPFKRGIYSELVRRFSGFLDEVAKS